MRIFEAVLFLTRTLFRIERVENFENVLLHAQRVGIGTFPTTVCTYVVRNIFRESVQYILEKDAAVSLARTSGQPCEGQTS